MKGMAAMNTRFAAALLAAAPPGLTAIPAGGLMTFDIGAHRVATCIRN